MKITDQDIIRAARQLRDEGNEQLHVAPWHRQHRFRVPSWLVAIPAAAFLGFLLGIWFDGETKSDMPLTAMTDTVYVKVTEPSVNADTLTHAAPRPVNVRTKASKVKRSSHPSSGQSLAEDKIRYDLLVQN